MKKDNYSIIEKEFLAKGKDYTKLFKSVCSVAEEIGMDKALEYLEECVIQKKVLWLEENLGRIKRTKNPIDDVLKIFYEIYLGISFGHNGKVIRKTDKELVVRCWNKCPVLNACNKFGLDTKKICRQAYHRYAEVFLSRIHPKLKFQRNYNRIRPYSSFCEEKIILKN